LVKISVKADGLVWLKTIDNNLRTQPKHIWKYSSKFKRNDQSITQIEIRNKIIMQLQFIAETCADHVSSIFNLFSSNNTPNSSDCISLDFLNIPFIFYSDVK
jgi:hypothetical protein